jgi:Ring finger domain
MRGRALKREPRSAPSRSPSPRPKKRRRSSLHSEQAACHAALPWDRAGDPCIAARTGKYHHRDVLCSAAMLGDALCLHIASSAVVTAENVAGLADRCAVCLSPLDDIAVLDCMHVFCFACISHWIDASSASPSHSALCPLCKRAFTDIYYDIELASSSSSDAQVTPAKLVRCVRRQLPPRQSAARLAAARHSLTPRERALRRIAVAAQIAARGRRCHHTRPPSPYVFAIRPHFAPDVLARRAVYARATYAETLPSSQRRVDDAAGHFSGALLCGDVDRVKQFLHRDLQALLWRVCVDLEVTLAVNTFARGLSMQDTVHRLVPFVGQWSKHFAHESLLFMLSSYTMEEYDRLVAYNSVNDG